MNTKFLPGSVVADPTLGARQVRVIANSGLPDRVGDILEAAGCDLRSYRKNPIVLFQHDPTRPVGNASVSVVGSRLEATITFAPAGASRDADEACALMKSGVLGAVSVGFRPIASEPIRGGLGGLRYTEWALLELSCVSVPCDPDALVIARSLSKSGRVLNAQNAASVAALVRCLDKSAEAHADGCAELEKAAKHRERARHHAAQIAASAGDSGDASGDPEDDPGDDPEDDVELAYGRTCRKRLIAIAARAPGVPDPAADRRARMIDIASLAVSA